MSTPKTAPDFGEPWKTTNFRDGGIVTNDDRPIMEGFKLVKRAVACVNACAGMSDPAAEIQAMRDALAKARRCAEEWREHCLKRHTMSQIVSSKLPWEEKE